MIKQDITISQAVGVMHLWDLLQRAADELDQLRSDTDVEAEQIVNEIRALARGLDE